MILVTTQRITELIKNNYKISVKNFISVEERCNYVKANRTTESNDRVGMYLQERENLFSLIYFLLLLFSSPLWYRMKTE